MDMEGMIMDFFLSLFVVYLLGFLVKKFILIINKNSHKTIIY